MGYIIERGESVCLRGCDFIIRLDESRRNTPIKILQLTDMQVIDAAQRRYPERLGASEIAAWQPESFDGLFGDHARSIINQTRPDLIFITGDMVYGEFDDKGTTMKWFCALMDSFKIPWAPTFGNHDNESAMGVDWQCAQLANSKYCLFKRGEVSGNSNYTVGIAVGDELVRVLHMVDSNGCYGGTDKSVIKNACIRPDQLALIENNTKKITASAGRRVPAFMAFHIPVLPFELAEREKYGKTREQLFTLGVDTEAKDGDFGFKREPYGTIETERDFVEFAHANGVDGVFVGHVHNLNTCIDFCAIKWVFGMKTGQYDYHVPGQIGGTLIRLNGSEFEVSHVPALVKPAPMPRDGRMFSDFFAEEK